MARSCFGLLHFGTSALLPGVPGWCLNQAIQHAHTQSTPKLAFETSLIGIVKQILVQTAQKLSEDATVKRIIGKMDEDFVKRYIDNERRIGDARP